MSKVREIAWPEEFIELKRIEESMVCGICYEYMETTVMTPCSHNYCSLCIRKYLHYKSQCPACFHVFFEKDLYINRAMDVLIQHYITVREKLISLIENRLLYNTVVQHREETMSVPPVRPVRNNQIQKSPKIQKIEKSEPKTPKPVFPSNSTLSSDASSPTTHSSPKLIPSIAKIFNTPKRKETVVQSSAVAIKSVSCPVCSVDISEHHVNVHLDACLKREVSQKSAKEKKKPKRQPLPKLVLRVMKDAELRKKMKEFGLATNGDRKALENRFTRYSTIYNAECDKLEPRPVSELIRQCEMEEKQERKMDFFLLPSTSTSTATSSSTAVRLQIERDANEDKIEEAQKTYRMHNKSSFDKLVEEVRNRRKMQQTTERNEIPTTNSDLAVCEGDSNSAGNNLITEENSSVNPSAEIVFHDSDSDESCPLQHYRSDDPMKFLSVNMNNSSPSTSTSGSPVKRFQTPENSDCLENNTIKLKNTPEDAYEVSTDESTDNEVQNSPVTNRKLNHKKLKLSKISPRKSSCSETQAMISETDTIEKETREALARDLCDSIIDDFSFEGMSDDSFSEFSNKPVKNELNSNREKMIGKNSSKNVRRAPSRNKKTKDSFRKSVSEDEVKRVILGDFQSNATGGSCDDNLVTINSRVMNASTAKSTDISDEKYSEIQCNGQLENIETEKENDLSSANENSQPSINETMIRRPVRKRNRPSRYADNQINKSGADKITLNLPAENFLDNEIQDDSQFVGMSDGSLKRRRGRSKTKTNTGLHPEESQNPPKRPVRRRQIVADHD